MTIKKQFTFLICFIVMIPVICTIFLFIENYLHSHKRYLIEGYKEAQELEEDKDYSDAIKIMNLIPADVQSTLIDTENSKIITNTIPELNNVQSLDVLWNTLRNTSTDYFYQFTSPHTEKKTILITRIPRNNKKPTTPQRIIFTLLALFFLGIGTCIVSIFIISGTIFKSIIKIKNETREIANGNLNKPIIIENEKTQNEIMSILENLETMRQNLSESEKRKSNFIMGISHDLRTPVAIIKGYTEAITDNVITNETDKKSALKLIHEKTCQLEDMINDLIKFTKFNNFELREQMSTNSITELIKYFAKESMLSSTVFKREITSNIEISEDIYIPFNRQLVLRAFENLFSNALRYTKDGDKIEINAHIYCNFIWLELNDTGKGIKKEDIPHIFDLFYRSSPSRKGNSMGIGLAVVKNVIDVHGWDIYVNSEKGKGTCFTIKIPF